MTKTASNMSKLSKKERKAYVKPEPIVVEDHQVLRPQPVENKRLHLILAWGVFALSLIVYVLTQARTMSFWDSGEYATCISILGVPHPPGNPFYILFGRAIVALFGGIASHAVISAFISVLSSAFAVFFTYLITVKLASMFKIKEIECFLAGVVAALFTAFSFTFWMNAIEAEVYSGLVLFVNLILWLTLLWVEKAEDFDRQNILLLIVYLFFLGFCVHQTALQIAPAVLFIVVYPLLTSGVNKENFWLKVIGYTVLIFAGYLIFGAIGKSMRVDDFDKWGFALIAIVLLYIELNDIFEPRLWLLAIGLVLLGLSSHLFLMVRAADRPFINEGHPSTLGMFMDYVLRKQYGETSFLVRRASFFGDQMGFHFIRYFGMQWFNTEWIQETLKVPVDFMTGIAAVIISGLGLVGAWFHNKMNRHSFRYFLAVIILTTVVMVFVMNLSDREVRDRDYFFVVAYNMWAIWLGIGALALVQMVGSKAGKLALAAILLLLPTFNMVSQYKVHDRSKEYIALDYGVNFLNSLEENAIIFTNGDNDTFPLWYAQAVDDPHATETPVLKGTELFPTATSSEAISKAMAYKNKYLKGIRKDVTVANLSLLNKPWYIRQLRDHEGVLFGWDDAQLDKLYELRVPPRLDVSAEGANPPMQFSLELDNTPKFRPQEQGYRISDLAVMQIIKENFGKRPIYFAVTCESYIGFEEYTRNEGMVARVTHIPGTDQVNISRLLYNIDKVYQYRSIEDDDVYKDENMRRLVMNYGSGFVKAAIHFTQNGDYDKALRYVDRARHYIDTDLKLTEFYMVFYTATKRWDELDAFIENTIMTNSLAYQIYPSYVLGYLLEEAPDMMMRYLEKGMTYFNNDPSYAATAVSIAERYNQVDQAKAMFERLKGRLTYPVDSYIDTLNTM